MQLILNRLKLDSIITTSQLLTVYALTGSLVLGMHLLLRYLRQIVYFDMDQYWPVSIVTPRVLTASHWPAVLATVVAFTWLVKLARQNKPPVKLIIWFVLPLTIISSNLISGWQAGMIAPLQINDPGYTSYYDDAAALSEWPDLANLWRWYPQFQPSLRDHTRVHPPLAVSFYFAGQRLLPHPVMINLLILYSAMAAIYLLFLWLKETLATRSALQASLLLGLIPAGQIYFWAGFDSLIMALFWASAYFYYHTQGWRGKLLLVLFLLLSALSSFAIIWLVGWLVLERVINRQHQSQPAFVWALAGLGISLWLVYLATGYNYLVSLATARSFEGSQGFYGFEQPLSYLITRIEDLWEVIIFASPAVIWLWWQRVKENSALPAVGLPAVLSFGLFLLAGAYYTGETGRAAMYLYPFLLLDLHSLPIWQKTANFLRLSGWIFGLGLIMQIFGFFVW